MQANKERTYKIGKVKEYDGYVGEIVTTGDVYYFTNMDILNKDLLNPKDLVVFNGKTEETFPQAYNVKKLNMKRIK